jgi:hypothetical protein
MATWYGLVQPDTGELKSVGTIAMFPDGNLDAFDGIYDVHVFGETQPDFAAFIWSLALRALIDRPPPVLVSRLDDVEGWLLADADFLLVWNALNATRRSQLRIGIRRIVQRLLGAQVNRQTDETPEI